MAQPKEPQSYGSGQEWVKGNVGETVNRQKDTPPASEAEFYDEGRSPEAAGPTGGEVSDEQLAENAAQPGAKIPADEQPVTGVTVEQGGARRGGYFKDRDYT